MAKSKVYYEPDNYFPKALRKEFGLGEYNKEAQEEAEKAEEKKKANKRVRDYVNRK